MTFGRDTWRSLVEYNVMLRGSCSKAVITRNLTSEALGCACRMIHSDKNACLRGLGCKTTVYDQGSLWQVYTSGLVMRVDLFVTILLGWSRVPSKISSMVLRARQGVQHLRCCREPEPLLNLSERPIKTNTTNNNSVLCACTGCKYPHSPVSSLS